MTTFEAPIIMYLSIAGIVITFIGLMVSRAWSEITREQADWFHNDECLPDNVVQFLRREK